MESNSFRKLLLIFALLIAVPVMNALYGTMSAIITGIIVIAAIVIILVHFTTRTGMQPKNLGICSDITGINIKVNGRSYIISEGDSFNTEDHEQMGVMSYIENGVWYIADSPTEPANGAIAEITIPHQLRLNSFDVTVNSGNLLVNSLKAKRCAINVYNDFAEIRALNTTSLLASSGKGKLIINTDLKGSAQLSCGSGTLDISLTSPSSAFNIEASSGMGRVLLNNDVFTDSANRSAMLDNGSACTVKASCGLGRLSINFTEVTADDEN